MEQTMRVSDLLKSITFALLSGVATGFAQLPDTTNPQRIALPTITAQRFGDGGTEYWVFLPNQLQVAAAPVIVFVHGWGAMDPYLYGGWILHLVRGGYIVIYPRYQESLQTGLDEMTPNAQASVQDALQRLAAGPLLPDCDRFAIVGHSMGGFVAVNLASTPIETGLPVPKALMVVDPGDGEDRMPRLGERLPLADLSGLSTDTSILLLTGDADTVVGDRGAMKIWSALQPLAGIEKRLMTMSSDRRLNPPLIADHLAPLAVDKSFPEEPTSDNKPTVPPATGLHERWANRFAPDALDYDGYWKLLDDLLDSALSDAGRPFSFAGFIDDTSGSTETK